MANCKFCGIKAGLFRSAHAECAQKHRVALENVKSAVHQALVDLDGFEARLKDVKVVAEANAISVREYTPEAVEDLANIVSQRFQLGSIDRQFANAVKSCVKEFGLEHALGSHRETFNRLDYALVLSELKRGVLPREYNSIKCLRIRKAGSWRIWCKPRHSSNPLSF
jgi:hypothetical protein